jgi:hypothetical protein
MSAFKYEQSVVEGVEVSEVWGLDNVTDDKKEAVIKECIDRHAHRAAAQGYIETALTKDPTDSGHYVFKAWTP